MELLNFLNRIEDLCKQKGLKRQNVYIDCGVGKDFGVSIRNGSEPSIGKVFALASELDCSIDYLLGRTNNPNVHKCTALNVELGDISNNSGVIGGIANSAPVTINNGDMRLSQNAAAMLEIFNTLDTMSQAELLVHANKLKNENSKFGGTK